VSEPGLGRRLVTNTLHAASGRAAAMVVWLALTPAVLRALGVEGFGVWSLFFAFSGWFTALDLGLTQVVQRHVAAERARGDHAAAWSFATLGAIGYGALGALWLLLALTLREAVPAWLRLPAASRPDAAFALVASAVAFTFSGWAVVAMSVAQGYGRFDIANRTALAITFGQALGVGAALLLHGGLRGVVTGVVAGAALGAIAGALSLRGAAPGFHWQSPAAAWSRMGEAMRFGVPMQVANLSGSAHQHVDKLLLARFTALAAVTPYELGLRIAVAAGSLPQILLLAVLPAAAALHAEERGERLRALYDRGNHWVLAFVAPLAASILAAAGRFTGAWLGPGHDAATLALRALTLGMTFLLTTGMGTSLARAVGRTDLEGWYGVMAFVAHFAISLSLVPRFGLLGALIGAVGANLIGATYFLWRLAGAMAWPRRRVLLDPHVVPALAAVLGIAAGWAIDRVLPATTTGIAAWIATLGVGGVAGLVALAVCFGTRYVSVAEARGVLLPSLSGGRP